jgi:hypothetical protein
MDRHLVRRGTNGRIIWDRKAKGPAVAMQSQLINFESRLQVRGDGAAFIDRRLGRANPSRSIVRGISAWGWQ